MKTAKELYPDCILEYNDYTKMLTGKFDYWSEAFDYQPMLENFGEILIQIDDKDYQGDSRVLLKNNNKYGILLFGWGSCSGCDSLQGCNSYEEIDDLIKDLYNDIIWFESLEDCKNWVKNRDWELQYSYHCDETKEFIEKVVNY